MIDTILQDIENKGWSYQTPLMSKQEIAQLNFLFEQDFSPAQVGPVHQKVRNEKIRGDFTLWLDPLNPVEHLLPFTHFLDELLRRMNQRFYFGLKQYEYHLAKYPPGSFYAKHVDRFEKDSSRTVSFILYLNSDWGEENGGELVLFNKKGEVIQTVLPTPGSFICFLSEEFPHEVKPSRKERRSLTGWIHTKIIY